MKFCSPPLQSSKNLSKQNYLDNQKLGWQLTIISLSINLSIIFMIYQLIIYSMKCQISAKNAQCDVFKLFFSVKTTAQNMMTPYLLLVHLFPCNLGKHNC